MSVALTEAPPETTAPPEVAARYRVSVKEFDRMVDGGVFHPEARVELVDGELVKMSPIGVGHAQLVRELHRLLGRQLEGRAVVSVQCPLQCGDASQPQPDIALVRWPPDHYADRHPNAGDALLLVEVADSSLQYDLNVKVPLYASVGVPEVWLVDLPNGEVRVFTDLEEDVYVEHSLWKAEEVLRPVDLLDVEISLADLRLERFQVRANGPVTDQGSQGLGASTSSRVSRSVAPGSR
jgi:Uma2 family endonuclease